MFNFFKKKEVPFIKVYSDGTYEFSKKYIDFKNLSIIDETYTEALTKAVEAFNEEDKILMQKTNESLLIMQEDFLNAVKENSNEPYVRAIDAFTNNSNS